MGLSFFSSSSNDVHTPLRHCKIITCAEDTVIFTSSSNIDVIQSNLSQDLDNLSYWFRDNELIFNLKKGASEVMPFGTGKRLNLFQGCQVKLSINGSPINTTTCYKYLGLHLDSTLNFDTHFHKMYKAAAARMNLLRRIRSSIGTFGAQRIYSMIVPIFTYYGYNSLGWLESRERKVSNELVNTHTWLSANKLSLGVHISRTLSFSTLHDESYPFTSHPLEMALT